MSLSRGSFCARISLFLLEIYIKKNTTTFIHLRRRDYEHAHEQHKDDDEPTKRERVTRLERFSNADKSGEERSRKSVCWYLMQCE